jgi:hypothetical protein
MKHVWLAPIFLFVPSCLENEEELEIHPDGSVDVVLSARGDLADLADGYPVPLEPPWRPASDDARRWREAIGGDTGRAATRERAAAAAWPVANEKGQPQAELSVEGHFASVNDLPRSLVPPGEPYRTAYVERETSLAIERKPEGQVFVFQRTYRGFERARVDPLAKTVLPDEIQRKLDAKEDLTEQERKQVAALILVEHERAAEVLVRDAMLGLCTEGDLPTSELAGVLEEVRSASRSLVTEARLDHLLELVRTDGEAAGKELVNMEQEWRALLRGTLAEALAKRGVPETARNAAQYALEWQFTAFDHSSDVGDESFSLKVKMPGTIVSGNFASTADGVAHFRFDGRALQERDVVLRAVSVL